MADEAVSCCNDVGFIKGFGVMAGDGWDVSAWSHDHRYESGNEATAERRTRWVVLITLVTMVVEIVVGQLANSMALLADGLHMSTHAVALGIAAFAYWYARRHADDPRYSFGTGKVGVLAGYTSAIVLCGVAVLMIFESGSRLMETQTIAYDEALLVAVVGLVINLVCAVILGHGHDHGGHSHSGHDHAHAHHAHGGHSHGGHQDHNLRAAYIHVVTDAFTSVLAILALVAGKFAGWWWLDPVMGVVGAVVILWWARGLLADSGGVLLDRNDDDHLPAKVRAAIEAEAGDRVADLHLWRVGPGHWAAIVGVVSESPRPREHYHGLLRRFSQLSHVTIEVADRRGGS